MEPRRHGRAVPHSRQRRRRHANGAHAKRDRRTVGGLATPRPVVAGASRPLEGGSTAAAFELHSRRGRCVHRDGGGGALDPSAVRGGLGVDERSRRRVSGNSRHHGAGVRRPDAQGDVRDGELGQQDLEIAVQALLPWGGQPPTPARRSGPAPCAASHAYSAPLRADVVEADWPGDSRRVRRGAQPSAGQVHALGAYAPAKDT
mmetsp:Transcript_111801/g.310749  ORF Transcript_111801/g.310749 Transcript_111801/m.310749 type:complete len:203 (+) Transcript_111801:737-1345(+)